MNDYSHIAARVLNKPLLIEAGYGQVLLSALGSRLRLSSLSVGHEQITAADMPAFAADFLAGKVQAGAVSRRASAGKAYHLDGNVAVIAVDGSLMHKSGYVGSQSGAMGYDGLDVQLQAAMGDAQVQGILLDINSPGGEVAGVQALATALADSTKPVWAHANETAASAAYWLASAADKLVLSNTASVGSIGVLWAHTDVSKMLKDEGYKVTLIHAGAHKVDGNPYEPLPADVRADVQSEIDALHLEFAGAVAVNRKMKLQAVLATEARMYRGSDAVQAGLADKVASFDATLADFKTTLARTTGRPKGLTMSKPDNSTAPVAENHSAAATATQTAPSYTAQDLSDATATATTAATQAERSRIQAIVSSPEAAGRDATAQHLAFATSMDAEGAVALLATMPRAVPAAAQAAQSHANANANANALAASTLAQMGTTQALGADVDQPAEPVVAPAAMSASAMAEYAIKSQKSKPAQTQGAK